MSFTLIRLLIDFGLMILIWIIQLIVYPSFLHYTEKDLVLWHKKYTALIGYIAGLLMLGQLVVSVYQICNTMTLYHSISLVLIVIIWALTFLQFVPMHNKISKGRISESMLVQLVQKNWSRTILWTLLFIYSFMQIIT